ncbi:helix-turn-helix domain-containing protein, partial [Streptacidiphilus jiangxiensis]
MSESPAACRRLTEELRSLREQSGLSLAALAAKTPFSKSSWARYLSGAALPPWPAVLALAELVAAPQTRLRALWELAEAEWSRRGAVGSAASRAATGVLADREAGSKA